MEENGGLPPEEAFEALSEVVPFQTDGQRVQLGVIDVGVLAKPSDEQRVVQHFQGIFTFNHNPHLRATFVY